MSDLYQAFPEVLEQALMDQITENEDGSVDFTFGQEQEAAPEFNSNLAEHIGDSELTALASELVEAYEGDERSRSQWKKTYLNGLDLLGLKIEKRTEPWDGACGVFHPLLTDSVVRFQAQTIQEIFPARGPVKASIVGKVTTEKTAQAERVVNYMNYLSTKVMKEYRGETERLLFALPIAGSAFRKVYYDPTLGRACSMYVPAEDFCVEYGTSDLSICPRATHVMRKTENDVRKLQISGFYRDIDLDDSAIEETEIEKKKNQLMGSESDTERDSAYRLLEMHVEVDLAGFEDQQGGEDTRIALPYVITIDKSSMQILSIYRNWLKADPKKLKRDHFAHYMYLPGLGFYGFGLVHMIGGLTQSATAILRQLVDAGTIANLPGGLKTRGLRIKGDDSPIKPGEFRDVDVQAGTIGANITFLPYKEPSSVLYQLLGDLVAEGRRFASAADMKASDMNGEAPVGTTLAILEREMKVLTAVQARIHAAMGQELMILAGIIKDFGPERYPYETDEDAVVAQDFDERIDIIPVSDPNAGTMAQRIMQWQAVLQLSQSAPEIYDKAQMHRKMISVLGIDNAKEIVPLEEDLKPRDPISETMMLIKGEPIKAFLYQDHEAHIEAHMAAAEHPKLKEMMAQHPNVQAILAAGAAHLSEHLGFAYRAQIEQELGVQLPHPDEPLPDDIELRLSRLVAPAAAQLTGKAAKQQQAEENAKKQEDPIVQMAQKELEIKGQKVQADSQDRQAKIASDEKTKMAKIMSDLQSAMDKNKLERDKLAENSRLKGAELMVESLGNQMTDEAKNKDRATKQELEGYRMGLEAAMKMVQGSRTNGS